MRKTFLAFAVAALLAGCTTTTPPVINFSAIEAAAQQACGFVLLASDLPVINQIIAANPTLNTVDLIVATICAGVNNLPKPTHKGAAEVHTVPVVVNGVTYYINGHF